MFELHRTAAFLGYIRLFTYEFKKYYISSSTDQPRLTYSLFFKRIEAMRKLLLNVGVIDMTTIYFTSHDISFKSEGYCLYWYPCLSLHKEALVCSINLLKERYCKKNTKYQTKEMTKRMSYKDILSHHSSISSFPIFYFLCFRIQKIV